MFAVYSVLFQYVYFQTFLDIVEDVGFICKADDCISGLLWIVIPEGKIKKMDANNLNNENMTDAIDDRHIVAPDIPTSMTYDNYRSGKDPALEAALNFPIDKAHILFEDAGGRLIPRYLPWRRLSQKNAFEKKTK